MITCAKRATFECRHWHDGERALRGDKRPAQPNYDDHERRNGHHRGHGDPTGNVFQNVGGILDEPANDLRPASSREGAAGKGEKEYRREQEPAGIIMGMSKVKTRPHHIDIYG